jgi:hypothetical protein
MLVLTSQLYNLRATAFVPKDGGGWQKIPIFDEELGAEIDVATSTTVHSAEPSVMRTSPSVGRTESSSGWKDVEKKIGGLDSAADVRKALRKMRASRK